MVISGGTSGIGLACARRFLEGYQLVLTYAKDSERAQRVSQELGSEVLILPADVTSDEQIAQAHSLIVEKCGQVNVLINAAGVARFENLFVQAKSLSLCQEMMEVNYFGALRWVRQVLPGMYRRRQGRIINLGSVTGLGGHKGVIGYAESKAALLCFTKNLAQEVAHRGVSVSCVSPARVKTPMVESLLESAEPSSVNPPLGRPLETEEVAQAIALLVNLGVAATGTNLIIDGGTSDCRHQLKVR
jgi:3-oxoacyl-[acyl-carrier protein] reductase